MKWTEKTIEKGIRDFMSELNVDRMPTFQEMKENKRSGLSRAITLSGGIDIWVDKLNISRKEKELKWDEKTITEDLLKTIDILNIDRMPTAPELQSIGKNDLHCAISKTLKYSGWAQKLNLPLKTNSHTRIGEKNETIAKEILISKGYSVEDMTTRHAYDLLVNNSIKIDVKSGKAHYLFGSRAHTFGINKDKQTCDIYILIAMDEMGENTENIYIIPSHFAQLKTINIGTDSKYNRYIDAWHYIRQFDEFYKSIV